MNSLLTTAASSPAARPAPGAAGVVRLLITALEPAVGLGAARAQVALSHWLVAVMQAPAGRSYADLQAAFEVGAAWPPAPFPVGYVLLGYLDPRDLAAG
jgi:hypothetical protein